MTYEVIRKTGAGAPEGHHWVNRSVDEAVNMELHYALQHLDRPGTYVRILLLYTFWLFFLPQV